MYLPPCTFSGVHSCTGQSSLHLAALALIMLVGHLFNSLPLMYSGENCLHKPDDFHNVPAAVKCSLTARGQLHLHAVVHMIKMCASKASDYLPLSNGHVAFRYNFYGGESTSVELKAQPSLPMDETGAKVAVEAITVLGTARHCFRP